MTVGSLVLSLSLLAGVGLLIGKLIVDQQLAKFGETEWSVEIASVSSRQIVFEQISLTLRRPPEAEPEADKEEPSPVTLASLLRTPLPTWLPEKITINELIIRGRALVPYSPVKAQLTLITEPQKLDIQLQTPESLELVVTRADASIMVSATHALGTASLDYQLSNGQLIVAAHIDLPRLTVETPPTPLTVETDTVDISVKGSLSPKVAVSDLNEVVEGFSGHVAANLPDGSKLMSETLATELGGDIELQLNNGIIQSYRLLVHGDLLHWPELPLPLDTIAWQLRSQEQLTIKAMDYQQIVSKSRWPLELTAKVNGAAAKDLVIKGNGALILNSGAFKQLRLPRLALSAERLRLEMPDNPLQKITAESFNFSGNLAIDSKEMLIESTGKSSALLTTPYAKFDLTMQQASARLPMNAPQNADASALLKLDNFSELPVSIKGIDPKMSTQLAYHSGAISATGHIELTQNLSAQHETTITPQLRLSSSLKLDLEQFSESAQSSIPKKELNQLLQQLAPLLVINEASGDLSADLEVDLNTGAWQVYNSHLTLNKADFIYDTLVVTDAILKADLQVDETQLSVTNGNLSIASIQQGFSIGPLRAQFTADVPLNHLADSSFYLGEHKINAFDGSVTLPEQRYSLNQSIQIPIVFEQIKLGELLRQYPTNNIAIDGAVSGTIPLYWDSQELTVNNGYLSAVAPGGHLQVDASALSSAMGNNPSLKILAGVLENFYYQELSSVIDYDENGELMLKLQLQGYNPDFQNGRTINLNITIDEDLPALIKGLQLSSSVSDIIRQRIQKRVN
ncbi:YdbH domain-containing protein [Idiomarina sp. HP20-50]|uniref:YdbH domain-containing protein n=1 Tax=Idiomarina sp. HP20-50 TaxID=3070813 RepID=UPI00294B8D83|nr:YdbH domain-containing protein [Idiomarina sp. HP20-50]MDV6315158.1 YdbH domain-containing protein [Idiomarina sp. HP20-50]